MKTFACGDVVPGCTATFAADDDDGILAAVSSHAAEAHGLTAVPDELVVSVRQHIRTA